MFSSNVALKESSQDMRCSRGRQPQTLGNAQPRHRSESRRLSDCQRPMKTVVRKRDHLPGALHEGDAVRVFSRSADKWLDGEVVKFVEGNFLRVEYEVGEYWCGKTLHVNSDYLVIPSAAATISAEDGDKQDPAASASDFQSPSCRLEPASDPRWLLSCKYDVSRRLQRTKAVVMIEQMLGQDVVSNPNRFSKTCCTIAGEVWDDNYNRGKNAEKYRRCWEPNAPRLLQCTKPVASGQEPTTMTCWKSSYFWRLKRSRKMLRVIEGNELGDGQEIEKAMAEFLQSAGGGCEIRVIESGAGGFRESNNNLYCQLACHVTPHWKATTDLLSDHIPDGSPEFFIDAMVLAPMLAHAGFGSPRAMMLKVIKELDEPCFPQLAAVLADCHFKEQLKADHLPDFTFEMYKAMPITEKMEVREEWIAKLQATIVAELEDIQALHPNEVNGLALDAFMRREYL